MRENYIALSVSGLFGAIFKKLLIVKDNNN